MDAIRKIDVESAILEITMESDFQYDVSINDNVKIETNNTIFEGIFIAVDDSSIQLRTKNNIVETIAFDEIKQISYA